MQCVSARDLFQTCSFTLSYLKGLYSCLRISIEVHIKGQQICLPIMEMGSGAN